MRSIFSILTLMNFICLVAPSVQATNKVGNGGNVVQCRVLGETKTVLLDFYESETDPKSEIKKAKEIAEEAIAKIKSSAPKLAGQYLKRLSEIQAEISYRDDVQLMDVPDSKHLFKPLSKDCEILQVAVRNNLALPSDKKFLIRKDLWDQLAPTHQAGLLTHEIIHEHLTKLGEENSIKARRINAFLYNKNTKSKEFWKLIKELEVPVYP